MCLERPFYGLVTGTSAVFADLVPVPVDLPVQVSLGQFDRAAEVVHYILRRPVFFAEYLLAFVYDCLVHHDVLYIVIRTERKNPWPLLRGRWATGLRFPLPSR